MSKETNNTNNDSIESYEREEIDSGDEDFLYDKVVRRMEATDKWKSAHLVVRKDEFLKIYPFLNQYEPKQFAKIYKKASKMLSDSKYCILYILLLLCFCIIMSISHILL